MKKKFVIMNTHYYWDEPYVSNTSKLNIQKQQEISGILPTVLIGDFNLSPNSDSHALFCGKKEWNGVKGRFIDAWLTTGKSEPDAGTYNGFKGDHSGDRIDWILATPEFCVEHVHIIHDHQQGHYPSDHFPVLVALQLK